MSQISNRIACDVVMYMFLLVKIYSSNGPLDELHLVQNIFISKHVSRDCLSPKLPLQSFHQIQFTNETFG